MRGVQIGVPVRTASAGCWCFELAVPDREGVVAVSLLCMYILVPASRTSTATEYYRARLFGVLGFCLAIELGYHVGQLFSNLGHASSESRSEESDHHASSGSSYTRSKVSKVRDALRTQTVWWGPEGVSGQRGGERCPTE